MFDEHLFRDRTLIITGGGTGLGLAMAERFAELGAHLVLAARDEARLQRAAEQLRERHGREVLPVSVDIRDPEATARMVERAVAAFGKVYGLINNAAGNFLAATEDLSPRGFEAVVDIVLKGTFFATQAVGRRLIEQGEGGAILSILTTYVHSGSSFVVPSAMAKAGVLAMTRSLAVEWGTAYGIRANAIAPGPFPTEGAFKALVPEASMVEGMRQRIPLKRLGEPRELADLAAFLMAPGSAFINGECVSIDGGEQLMGAGEFNEFAKLDRAQLKDAFAAMRPPRKDAGRAP
jgi:NAD(P)-dependent dehydrogenase (short-subunit alcohol dehydrogenase family)